MIAYADWTDCRRAISSSLSFRTANGTADGSVLAGLLIRQGQPYTPSGPATAFRLPTRRTNTSFRPFRHPVHIRARAHGGDEVSSDGTTGTIWQEAAFAPLQAGLDGPGCARTTSGRRLRTNKFNGRLHHATQGPGVHRFPPT
jgi:hypothetical protein